MTWTFDYTATFAIGSLVIILAGALIFYLGMLFCDSAETEYGKFGIPKKYDKIKYYKYGALFLQNISSSIIILFALSIFALSQILAFLSLLFKIDLTHNINFNFSDHDISLIFGIILFTDLFSSIIQLFLLNWNLKQIEKFDNEDFEYSKKLHARCIYQSSIPIISLIAVSIVSIFLIYALYSTITNGKVVTAIDFLRIIIISIIVFAFYVILPLILALLNILSIAVMQGRFFVQEEMSDLKQVDKYVVYLKDGRRFDGHKLNYKNGIYILSGLDNLDNIETEFSISEDTIRHIERIYDNEKNGYAALDRVVNEMIVKFDTTRKFDVQFLKKKSITEKDIISIIHDNPHSGGWRLEISNRAKKELSVDAIRVLVAHEFSHWYNYDSPLAVSIVSCMISLGIFLAVYIISLLIAHIFSGLIFPTWLGIVWLFLMIICTYLFYCILSIIQEIRADAEAFQVVGNLKAVKDYLDGLKKNKQRSVWHCLIYPIPTIQQRGASIDFIELDKLQKSFDWQNKPKRNKFLICFKCILLYLTKNIDMSNASDLPNMELAVKVLNNVKTLKKTKQNKAGKNNTGLPLTTKSSTEEV